MCIGVGEPDGGQRRERPLDGDQVGDDLDGLGFRGPSGRIWLRLDPRQLAGCARALGRRGGPVAAPGQPTGAPDPTASTLRSAPSRAHSARSASLARIFTHTSCPAPLMCRCRWEGQRGLSPPPGPAGTREAWPQRVGWLTCLTCPPCAEQTRRATLGNLRGQNLHTTTWRRLLFAVSTVESGRISQEVHPRTGAGPASANGLLNRSWRTA